MPDRLRILAVDVGTGTQDVLLFEGDRTIENCYQLILPSPTVIVADRIRRATAAGRPVLLTGHTMGGGPSAWAARDHAQAGLPCYATPDAARTLDDDLTAVEAIGLRVIPDDEARRLLESDDPALVHVDLRDFDGAALRTALTAFGVDPAVDLVAVAADAVAYLGDAPDSAARVVVMDTGAAAVAGALEDPTVRQREECLVANIGNFHTLAFHLRTGRIAALFEHHTGELTRPQLEGYLSDLAAGTLSNERVFAESGHGALTLSPPTAPSPATRDGLPFLAVTGPRRELLRGSALRPYEAVPHGDMMLAGCYGLLRAVAVRLPETAPAIESVLGPPPES